MQDIKAIIVDEEWFQVYDNKTVFTETYVASGLYWNYFLHTWKTIAHSPFANAVVFASANGQLPTFPASLTAKVDTVADSDKAVAIALSIDDSVSLSPSSYKFEQTEDLTEAGVAVQKYGALIVPKAETPISDTLDISVGDVTYSSAAVTFANLAVGTTITFQKQE